MAVVGKNPETSHLGPNDFKLYVVEGDIRRRLHDTIEKLRASLAGENLQLYREIAQLTDTPYVGE